jgi:RNA-splicing ligase RtcB
LAAGDTPRRGGPARIQSGKIGSAELRKICRARQLDDQVGTCRIPSDAVFVDDKEGMPREVAPAGRKGDLGIIPGSMGARSFIVRGKGNADSFHTCSHGAGRAMSRTEAKRRFSLEDHVKATAGIECRKDVGVIDETPMAYKDIDAVMAAQADLVDIVHTLRQVVCVKG